jgi:hypothetical protein
MIRSPTDQSITGEIYKTPEEAENYIIEGN